MFRLSFLIRPSQYAAYFRDTAVAGQQHSLTKSHHETVTMTPQYNKFRCS